MEKLRPLTFSFSCLALIAAVTAAEFFAVSAGGEAIFFAALFSLALLFFVLYRKAGKKTGFSLCLFLSLFAALGLFSHFFALNLPRERVLSRGEGEGTFTVLSVGSSYGEESCLCYLHTLEGERIGGKVTLTFSYRPGLAVGEHFRVRASFSPAKEGSAEGVLASGEAGAAIPAYGKTPFLPSLAALRLRAFVSDRIARALGGEEGAAALARAVLTGDRSGIAGSVRRDFERAGASHLLAVSGMHLSVLVGGLALVLRVLPVGRRARSLILLAAAGFYSLLAGLSPSVLRAAFMLGCHALARVCGRKKAPLGALVFAAAFLLLLSPGAAASVSFWMSVFAAFGVLYALSLDEKRKKEETDGGPLRVLRRTLFSLFLLPLFVGVFASLCVLPVTALVFRRVSLLSPLTTLLCTPFLTALLPLAAAAAVVGTPFSPLSALAGFLSDALTRLCAALSSPRGLFISLREPFFPALTAVFLLLLLLSLCLSVRRRRYAALLLTALFLAGAAAGILSRRIGERDLLCGAVLPLEPGETLVFSSSEGALALSCGRGAGTSRQAAALGEGLSLLGKTEAAHYLVFDEPTEARRRALLRAADRVLLRTVWLTEAWRDPALEEELASRGSAVGYFRAGEELIFGDTRLLAEKSAPAAGRTLSAFSLSVSSGEARLLWLSSGVSDSPARELFYRAAAEADLVILGTAGPETKTPLFLPLSDGAVLLTVGGAGETLAPALRERLGGERLLALPAGGRFSLEKGEKNGEKRDALTVWK